MLSVRRAAQAAGGILLVALLPGALLARQAPVVTTVGADAGHAWEMELVEVERELAEIEHEALLDPEMRRLNQELGGELEAAMAEADPGLRLELGRLDELDERARAATDAHDLVTLAQLTSAIERIEDRFRRAQAAALRRPELADRVEVFHALVRERMRRADPRAERLFARYAELQRLLADTAAVAH